MADPSIPIGLSLERILDFAPVQSDKDSILDGATRLASSLMDASTQSTCKLASAYNSFAWPLTADLTIKVEWVLDPVIITDIYKQEGVDFIIDDGVRVAEPSTVVDLTGDYPTVIRLGKGPKLHYWMVMEGEVPED